VNYTISQFHFTIDIVGYSKKTSKLNKTKIQLTMIYYDFAPTNLKHMHRWRVTPLSVPRSGIVVIKLSVKRIAIYGQTVHIIDQCSSSVMSMSCRNRNYIFGDVTEAKTDRKINKYK